VQTRAREIGVAAVVRKTEAAELPSILKRLLGI
jgi:hypothetical protein